MGAVKGNFGEIAKVLIEAGANPDNVFVDDDGKQPQPPVRRARRHRRERRVRGAWQHRLLPRSRGHPHGIQNDNHHEPKVLRGEVRPHPRERRHPLDRRGRRSRRPPMHPWGHRLHAAGVAYRRSTPRRVFQRESSTTIPTTPSPTTTPRGARFSSRRTAPSRTSSCRPPQAARSWASGST